MATAYLISKGIKAHVTSERIEVTVPRKPDADHEFPQHHWIPLFDLDKVVVDSQTCISVASITKLLRRSIPISFISNGHFPAGVALPYHNHSLSLANQLDASRDNAIRLQISKSLIVAKIQNMRRVLQRIGGNRNESITPVLQWFKSMKNQALACASVDSLRGIEGVCSGRYFELLARYFPEDLPFERRSRRPPHNEANALLSFVYTLLASEINLSILSHNLEPGWGFYHETEDGRPSLALDLIEPFRAPIADALAVDLLNHRRLKKDDFEQVDGGVLLKRKSRYIVYSALEERLEREFYCKSTGTRTNFRGVFREHCWQIKRIIRGESDFQPFIMH